MILSTREQPEAWFNLAFLIAIETSLGIGRKTNEQLNTANKHNWKWL